MSNYHTPALLQETINGLNVTPSGKYIDCTLGGGGHTREILRRGGKVLAIDMDPEAIEEAKKWQRDEYAGKLTLVNDNFSNLLNIARSNNFDKISGILFDLGVSTHQLEAEERGFSFNTDVPLDMRMSPNLGVTAADLINGLNVGELSELFQKYGEENFARPIAKAIVKQREKYLIKTCKRLAEIIVSVRHRGRGDRTHPATRVFQALRIAVNDELNALKVALPQTIEILEPKGRLAIISFHSLEDRIVKHFIKEQVEKKTLIEIAEKPITPTDEEVLVNPHSRSAKLRVAERI